MPNFHGNGGESGAVYGFLDRWRGQDDAGRFGRFLQPFGGLHPEPEPDEELVQPLLGLAVSDRHHFSRWLNSRKLQAKVCKLPASGTQH